MVRFFSICCSCIISGGVSCVAGRSCRFVAGRTGCLCGFYGSSADIIKLAMINIHRRLKEDGYRSKMVLQIHDELLFDALPSEVPELQALVKDVMEHVMNLRVPLTVECSAGANWLEAH